MKYSNGKKIRLGDNVIWQGSDPIKGIVVSLIDENIFLDDYDYTYLSSQGGGVMIKFEKIGLVHIQRDDNIDFLIKI
ncbi:MULTISPECIES: hypothetical protein [Rodentibacter]|uniref:Uncharacterized protein n=1 Tax=Rodentibacter pneumotropicus TaxID=758 RepID=A0A1V3K4S2_9PAST|nr:MULTISPECIES: hypothetical protein [Rodentibacter]MCQ9121879.1 hypothetical protein [Rodentibacter pneumotropicus]MDC2825537.1 hypothetical protein [Rodentibacter pneumotropicus]OOF60486.1 hypothetical protein BKL50_09790 [Rodentibacter pneumotropicus]OOF68060.1 hypothetical protein BKG95_04945 [Rodentibacter pneumotropicus]QIA75975.1 hypothetical protein FEE42_00620 [Rodentibacter heylii]